MSDLRIDFMKSKELYYQLRYNLLYLFWSRVSAPPTFQFYYFIPRLLKPFFEIHLSISIGIRYRFHCERFLHLIFYREFFFAMLTQVIRAGHDVACQVFSAWRGQIWQELLKIGAHEFLEFIELLFINKIENIVFLQESQILQFFHARSPMWVPLETSDDRENKLFHILIRFEISFIYLIM